MPLHATVGQGDPGSAVGMELRCPGLKETPGQAVWWCNT